MRFVFKTKDWGDFKNKEFHNDFFLLFINAYFKLLDMSLVLEKQLVDVSYTFLHKLYHNIIELFLRSLKTQKN